MEGREADMIMRMMMIAHMIYVLKKRNRVSLAIALLHFNCDTLSGVSLCLL